MLLISILALIMLKIYFNKSTSEMDIFSHLYGIFNGHIDIVLLIIKSLNIMICRKGERKEQMNMKTT